MFSMFGGTRTPQKEGAYRVQARERRTAARHFLACAWEPLWRVATFKSSYGACDQTARRIDWITVVIMTCWMSVQFVSYCITDTTAFTFAITRSAETVAHLSSIMAEFLLNLTQSEVRKPYFKSGSRGVDPYGTGGHVPHIWTGGTLSRMSPSIFLE